MDGTRIYVDNVLSKYNMSRLEVRRKHQLLGLMYVDSKRSESLYEYDDVRMTAKSASKVKFKFDFRSLTRVQNIPLYRGLSL